MYTHIKNRCLRHVLRSTASPLCYSYYFFLLRNTQPPTRSVRTRLPTMASAVSRVPVAAVAVGMGRRCCLLGCLQPCSAWHSPSRASARMA